MTFAEIALIWYDWYEYKECIFSSSIHVYKISFEPYTLSDIQALVGELLFDMSSTLRNIQHHPVLTNLQKPFWLLGFMRNPKIVCNWPIIMFKS